MGTNCELCGREGDRKRYDPPNALDEDVKDLLRKSKADYFGNVRPPFQLADPPGGAEVDREIQVLRDYHRDWRSKLMPRIADEKDRFEHVFEKVIGIDMHPDASKPHFLHLMTAICAVAEFWAVRFKARFNRARPVQIAPDLDPPFCPGHAAYPSGHASAAHACALALIDAADIYPALHAPIESAANSIAYHREVAGVHYPSDSASGKALAEQLVAALRAEAGYVAKVSAARSELERLIGRP